MEFRHGLQGRLHIQERHIADCAKADSEYGASVAAAPGRPNGRLEMKNILGSYGSMECHWVGDGFPVRSVLCYGSLGAQISPVSIAPGTAKIGHGGFTYYEGRDLLKEVATRSEVMGVDFADVSPRSQTRRLQSSVGRAPAFRGRGESVGERRATVAYSNVERIRACWIRERHDCWWLTAECRREASRGTSKPSTQGHFKIGRLELSDWVVC